MLNFFSRRRFRRCVTTLCYEKIRISLQAVSLSLSLFFFFSSSKRVIRVAVSRDLSVYYTQHTYTVCTRCLFCRSVAVCRLLYAVCCCCCWSCFSLLLQLKSESEGEKRERKRDNIHTHNMDDLHATSWNNIFVRSPTNPDIHSYFVLLFRHQTSLHPVSDHRQTCLPSHLHLSSHPEGQFCVSVLSVCLPSSRLTPAERLVSPCLPFTSERCVFNCMTLFYDDCSSVLRVAYGMEKKAKRDERWWCGTFGMPFASSSGNCLLSFPDTYSRFFPSSHSIRHLNFLIFSLFECGFFGESLSVYMIWFLSFDTNLTHTHPHIQSFLTRIIYFHPVFCCLFPSFPSLAYSHRTESSYSRNSHHSQGWWFLSTLMNIIFHRKRNTAHHPLSWISSFEIRCFCRRMSSRLMFCVACIFHTILSHPAPCDSRNCVCLDVQWDARLQ